MIGDSLRRFTHRLADDDRAVSPVVGFLLMFAFVMILFTLYQTNVVPAENQEVEFEHSQTVESQMGQLSSAIIGTSSTGTLRSVTLSTGLQYPSRTLAINPGNPVGTLQSVPVPNVSISNVYTDRGMEDFTFNTSFLSYRPNYNRLNEETVRTVENGMLSRTYSSTGSTRLVADNSVITDDKITLIMLAGGYQSSQMTTTVTTSEAWSTNVSASGSNNSSVTLPTTVSEDTWQNSILSGTNHTIGAYDEPEDYTGPEEVRMVTIEINGTVGVPISEADPGGDDDDADDFESKYYLDNATPNETVEPVDEPTKVAVQVRNQFGNPPSSGEDLTLEASVSGDGGGSLKSDTRPVNASGMATFTYTPAETDAGSNVTITASLQDESESGPIEFEIAYPELRIEAVTPTSVQGAFGSENVTVRTVDAAGHTLSGISLSSSHNGSGAFSESPTSSNGSGLATFTYAPGNDNGSVVGVEIAPQNAGSEESPVVFGLEYGDDGPNREPLNANNININGNGQESDIQFKITPGQPVTISGFSIVTKDRLEALNETGSDHTFEITKTRRGCGGANGLDYQSPEPIQFDGQDYTFRDGPCRIPSSPVQLQKWDWSNQVTFSTEFADTYEEADMVIYFITEEGKRPVYLNGHMPESVETETADSTTESSTTTPTTTTATTTTAP